MSKDNALNHAETLMILNFATRLMALDLDEELLCERALEGLSDFSANCTAALFTLSEDGETLRAEGIFVSRRFRSIKREIAWRDTPLAEVVKNKQHGFYPAMEMDEIPLPVREGGAGGNRCLCLPLAGVSTKIIGIVTIEQPAGCSETGDLHMLMILATVIAISIENGRLFKLATRDGLTGLNVRTVFDIRLKEEFARLRRYGDAFSVLLVDIDHFKKINDTMGHSRGDVVLRELAGLIRQSVRGGGDIVCRYGGDEFIVLMTAAGREEALSVAERVRRQCEGHDSPAGKLQPAITVSMGLVTVEDSAAVTAEEVVERADLMLYRAKRLGRNRVCVWP